MDKLEHPKLGEEQIYQILRSAILSAQLPPDTQLVETSLAESFGVSRTPIRSVLRRLQYESLVQILPNRGAFVYCPTEDEAKHIFRVRQLLEPEASRLAAIHATEEELNRMNQFLQMEKQEYQQGKVYEALQAISDFHIAVIQASRNAYLIRYLQELITLSHIILTFYDITDDEGHQSSCEHKALFDALCKRDGDQAYLLAYQHIYHIQGDVDYSKKTHRVLSIEQIISRYTSSFS